MIEKVNPSHPDKIADRIAGAIVDLAYKKQDNPKIAVEVLIGHGECKLIIESSVGFEFEELHEIVDRIAGKGIELSANIVPQDEHLAANQAEKIKCGDNGIFKGVPSNLEESCLSVIVRKLYRKFPTDGKFISDEEDSLFIACQSNANSTELGMEINELLHRPGEVIVNPLGEWTGGTNVDTGATNRKLGSDMGRAVTGGGLHGKDLSKADVSVNIACHILAEQERCEVEACCAIGDSTVAFKIRRNEQRTDYTVMDYAKVVEMARDYINKLGGFEKLAEWGLI